MAGHALQVEPVEHPPTPVSAGERGAHAGSATIYWWQIALLAARAGALEHELGEVRRDLERERRQRQRVIARYERLLAKREDEIGRLEAELERERSGPPSGSSLRSLFSR